MTNWTPSSAQRAVLTICGTALFIHAYYKWFDDESISLPILGGALLYTAALSNSSQVELIAASTWDLITRRWRQIAIFLIAVGAILAVISYRQFVAEQAAHAKEQSEYEAAMRAREADMKVRLAKIDTAYSNCMKAAPSEGITTVAREPDPARRTLDQRDFWTKYIEDNCKYKRDTAIKGIE